MVNLRNLAAIKTDEQDEQNVLGNLVWYTITEQLVARDVLARKLQNAGIDEGFMPPKIRLPGAFRRATAAVERKKEIGFKEGVTENYLVREVSCDSEHILRKIVRETKDAEDKSLDYHSNVSNITLDKTTGTISWESEFGIPREMCQEAERLFSVYQIHHDSRCIRAMVYKILASMAPTPVRPSGGIYFVPYKYEADLKKLVSFLQSLEGNSEGFQIPLINTTENKDMIRTKLNNHIRQTLNNLAFGLRDPSLTKGKANPLLSDAKSVLDNFVLYQETLSDELSDMKTMIGLIKRQMLTIVDKITA
jgi:hypothetical protein